MKSSIKQIILIVALTFFGMSLLKSFRGDKQEVKDLNYIKGTYYSRIEEPKKGFIGNLLSGFMSKEDKVKSLKEDDLLKITFSEKKIEDISLISKKDVDSAEQKVFNEIKTKVLNKEVIENEKTMEPKEFTKNLLNTIEQAHKKYMEKERKAGKVYPGTFKSIVPNGNELMEVEVLFGQNGLEKIKVFQDNLTVEETEEIYQTVEILLEEKTMNVFKNSKDKEHTKAFYSLENGLEDIKIQAGIGGLKPVITRSNIVWQSLKDVTAALIFALHKLAGDFGIAIILTTIVIKILLLPLTLKQDKSMQDMKKLQPELEKIKEKYKNDKQLLNQRTMELYKEHKINPAGGCLPLLIQMPILFALFGVLRSGIIPEFASVVKDIIVAGGASIGFINGFLTGPKFLWLDLLNADPFYVLPILTAAVTFLQQKITVDKNSNPQMKQMMYMMPIMMLFISSKMPAGLQLYWFVSTLLGVVQQYFILTRGRKGD